MNLASKLLWVRFSLGDLYFYFYAKLSQNTPSLNISAQQVTILMEINLL